eukprot:466615_1
MSTQSLTNADKLQINWMHIIQCIKHEMWPQLASVINAMIENEENKININDLSEKCVESVMKTLKEKKTFTHRRTTISDWIDFKSKAI